MDLRSFYGFNRHAVSLATGLACKAASLTKQEFKEECDINTIAQNFGIGSEMPVGVRMPTYDDFSGVRDFKSAMDAIARARESFDAMPARVRERFRNDPQEFVAFCSRESNLQEAIGLGLVREEVVAAQAAQSAVSANPAPTTGGVQAPAGA